jgi:uncharacterized surface protein with fasciclin (FAS1) repeats
MDAATVEPLKTDGALLSRILTCHVVPGRIRVHKDQAFSFELRSVN